MTRALSLIPFEKIKTQPLYMVLKRTTDIFNKKEKSKLKLSNNALKMQPEKQKIKLYVLYFLFHIKRQKVIKPP